jgi:hypothetical protein
MKLLIMQFFPTSCHFVSRRYKYSPQHPVLKQTQSMFLQHLKLRPSRMWCHEHVASILRIQDTYTTNILAGGDETTWIVMYVNNWDSHLTAVVKNEKRSLRNSSSLRLPWQRHARQYASRGTGEIINFFRTWETGPGEKNHVPYQRNTVWTSRFTDKMSKGGNTLYTVIPTKSHCCFVARMQVETSI